MDRRTDGIATAYTRYSIYAVARKNCAAVLHQFLCILSVDVDRSSYYGDAIRYIDGVMFSYHRTIWQKSGNLLRIGLSHPWPILA